jgi:hypothetical protein
MKVSTNEMFLCRTRELLRTEMFAWFCDGTIMPYITGPP